MYEEQYTRAQVQAWTPALREHILRIFVRVAQPEHILYIAHILYTKDIFCIH